MSTSHDSHPSETESDSEEDKNYTSINKLNNIKRKAMKISPSDIQKLKESSHFTVESMILTPKSQLTQIKGISESKAEKLQKAAMELLPKTTLKFVTADTLYQKRKRLCKITTGSAKLDDLLGGGIETGSITEIYGEYSTGKTQICHQLCITTQFPIKSGGAEGCVLYIDTAGTFRPKRIAQMVERFGMDADDVLDNIAFCRAYTTEDQMELFKEMRGLMTNTHYGLVIIDSGTGLFRTEFVGRGSRLDRDYLLRQFFAELRKLCDIFGVAVVITNQIEYRKPGRSEDKYDPWGDEVESHCVTTRVELKKRGFICQRINARIVKSPHLAEEECVFCIDSDGIIDD